MKKIAFGRCALALAAVVSAGALLAPSVAAAEEAPISGGVAFTTDYVWRGITHGRSMGL
jgi:hypothetical protein